MSQTKFDNIIRCALWNSHKNKCFYCEKEIEWNELHIDHIIPESFAGEKLERIIADYELNENFDINGLINLVPTHCNCNLRKSNTLFNKKTTLYYLGLTEKKTDKIEEEIQKLRTRKNKGQFLSKLQSALSSDLISIHELQDILSKAKNENWDSYEVKLPHPIEFIDEIYDVFYLNQNCSELYDKKMVFGGGYYNYIELTNEKNEIKKVSTLHEWKSATTIGYYPKTNADNKMSSGLAFLENLLNALHSAKMPKVSFISEPWIGIENLDNLSPNVLHDFDGSLKKYAKMNISVGELVRKGLVKINNSERYSISLEFEGMETSLIEQFRADFNSDGVEDIFVRGWARAIGGTLGYGFSTILTRYSNKHLIEDISEEKKYSQKQHDLRTTELKNLIMNLRNKKNN